MIKYLPLSNPLAAFAGILATATALACLLPTGAWAEDEAKEAVTAEDKIHWTRGFYEFDERSMISRDEMAFTNRVHYDSFYHDDPYKYEDSNDLFGFWKSINIEKDPQLAKSETKRGQDREEADEAEEESPRKAPLFERMFENRKSEDDEAEEPAPKVTKKPAQTEKSVDKASDPEPLFQRLFKRDADEVEGE